MKFIKYSLLFLLGAFVLLLVGFNLWGWLTLGTIEPDPTAARDSAANRVVMVFGATGSVGDGLLKAAIEDPDVEKVYVITRRSSLSSFDSWYMTIASFRSNSVIMLSSSLNGPLRVLRNSCICAPAPRASPISWHSFLI